MVIKLQSKKKTDIQAPVIPKQNSKFTIKDVEDLFKVDNWHKFYKINEPKFWIQNLNIYDWPVFPCVSKDHSGFYHCVLHPTVDVNTGTKINTVPYRNINYSELVSHCIFYKPKEHKAFILKKLFNI